MATLNIAANKISASGILDYGHLQLVLNDGTSLLEIEVQAPGSIFFGSWTYPSIRDHAANTPNYEVDENYSITPIALGGRLAEDVWGVIAQVHSQFSDKGGSISYDVDKNSNSYVNSLLYTVGISVGSYTGSLLRDDIDSFPGVGTNVLLSSADAISLHLRGGGGDDFIRTGVANDTLEGNAGADKLYGGDGHDTFTGGLGNDQLYGGEGIDTATFTEAAKNYDIRSNSDGTWTVSHVRGSKVDGVDILSSIELAKFTDRTMDVALNSITSQVQFALVFDTTGSMSPYLGQVRSTMASIVQAAFGGGTMNAQIAISGFKEPGDVTTYLSMTTQTSLEERQAAALSAINSIGVGGGGDIPEGQYSATLHALSGGVGEWWGENIARRIVLVTDAPAKDSDLAAEVSRYAADFNVDVASLSTSRVIGGLLTTATFTAASDGRVPSPIQIYTVLVGPNSSSEATIRPLAEDNGGQFFDANSLSDLTAAIIRVFSSPLNATPVITSNGGGDAASISVAWAEISGTTIITEVAATDSDSGDTIGYRIFGGEDASAFRIDPVSGALSFRLTGGEVPFDLDDDGTFEVIVGASDGLAADRQMLAITVTDRFPSLTLNGGNGNDILTGNAGADTLFGGNGQDALYGLGGPDALFGGNGTDNLFGGAGSDLLSGNLGGDELNGGAGADSFLFGHNGAGDTITDFNTSEDKILLADGLTIVNFRVDDFDKNGLPDLLINFTSSTSATLLGVNDFSAVRIESTSISVMG